MIFAHRFSNAILISLTLSDKFFHPTNLSNFFNSNNNNNNNYFHYKLQNVYWFVMSDF